MLQGSQITTLKNDINGHSSIFSSLVTAGNDAGVAAIYNTASSGYSALLNTVPQYNIFFWAASGTYGSIQSGSFNYTHPANSACIAALNLIGNTNTIFNTGDANQVNLFLKLKNEGIITSAQYISLGQACQKNPATSGEVLFGAGTTIDQGDVSQALRGYR